MNTCGEKNVVLPVVFCLEMEVSGGGSGGDGSSSPSLTPEKDDKEFVMSGEIDIHALRRKMYAKVTKHRTFGDRALSETINSKQKVLSDDVDIISVTESSMNLIGRE